MRVRKHTTVIVLFTREEDLTLIFFFDLISQRFKVTRLAGLIFY